jgi:hypothetical protein
MKRLVSEYLKYSILERNFKVLLSLGDTGVMESKLRVGELYKYQYSGGVRCEVQVYRL